MLRGALGDVPSSARLFGSIAGQGRDEAVWSLEA